MASPFGCCIQEVLLCCHPTLSEEAIAARLSLSQRLELTLHTLGSATDITGQSSLVWFYNVDFTRLGSIRVVI